MQERRRIDRKYLAIYSRVFDRSSGRVLGYLADLSQQGIMIISDDPLAENVIFNLRCGDQHLRAPTRVGLVG